GRIKLQDVVQEWQAQIERCLESGLVPLFLNSHEHIHMLPRVFRKTLELAQYYRIPFVRYANAEWIGSLRMSVLARNISLQLLDSINVPYKPDNSPTLLGVSSSGRLTLTYLQRRFPLLQEGQIYELMCHPGYRDSKEISDPRLLSYHQWEAELYLLQSDEMHELCKRYKVQISGYRDLLS